MKKIAFILPLLAIALTSCSEVKPLEKMVFCFDSIIDVKLYDGKKEYLDWINNICYEYDVATNYYAKGTPLGIYQINRTNDEIEIEPDIYDLLKYAFDVKDQGATYFDPMCGSLSEKWKESLAKKEILSETVINEELEKRNNSSFEFFEDYNIQRIGEATIDLGGIAKGYVLQKVYEYLRGHGVNKYIINGGFSSILLGEKNTKSGLFTVGLKEVKNAYIQAKNCFISTSSIYQQGVEINGVTYSHIINPVTGSAINENDGVIVISDNGAYGDAMSTSLMNNTLDEIKSIEQEHNIKTIVIKKNKIVYSHKDIEVKYH